MTQPKETPMTGGNRSQGHGKSSETSTEYAKALKTFKGLRFAPNFDERTFELYEADKFAEAHGITSAELAEIVRQTRPKISTDRFEWLEALTFACGRGHLTQRGLLVGLALFKNHDREKPYAWPSQKTLADRTGMTSDRAVRYGIASLENLGAIQRIDVTDLPKDLATKIMRPGDKGGFGRDPRSTAYKFIKPERWKVDVCTDRSGTFWNRSFRLKSRGRTSTASRVSLTNNHNSDTSQNVDTSVQSADRSELDSTWGNSNG